MRIGQYKYTIAMLYSFEGSFQKRREVGVLLTANGIDKGIIGYGTKLFSRSYLP